MTEPEEPSALARASAALRDHAAAEELDRRAAERWGKYSRFALACLSSVPWVGGLIGAAAAFSGEVGQERVNDLQKQWLEEHQRRLRDLEQAMRQITDRIEILGDKAQARAQSDEYLDLVRHGFRTWDASTTAEKRELVQKVLANAAGTGVSHDDVVRLFIDWIQQYHEIHFRVIRHIHRHPGATRSSTWRALHSTQPQDDSSEADLFRFLIRSLSTGGVIRQRREVNHRGEFVKRTTRKAPTSTMTSAFEDDVEYELTALGQDFVHYAMSEIVPRFGR